MPAAGQTGETLPLVKGTARPSRAATKYAMETRTVSTRDFPRETVRVLALLPKSEVFNTIYNVRRTRCAHSILSDVSCSGLRLLRQCSYNSLPVFKGQSRIRVCSSR